ncbi:hypothetical protein Bca52824_093341 [Brassica carinata]|uniref:Uncharacterized protein n=1 Tax=Brassica carinata TaxID=52824 RepID=A0A8X7P5V4_BRACI|nr:hypothetical protein Bca52824_093341 [Brassica carinata]
MYSMIFGGESNAKKEVEERNNMKDDVGKVEGVKTQSLEPKGKGKVDQDEPEAELVVGDVSSEIEPKGKGKVDQRLCLL